jgi:AcrR family transcriptional regulator
MDSIRYRTVMSKPTGSPPRGAGDWIDAAAAAFARGGLAAVRVEALARELGVTKGSFYWHFDDRAALLSAVIDRWEQQQTTAMIVESERGATPADRLRRLLAAVTEHLGTSRGELLLYLEAEHEGVRGAVERVTERRLDYVRDLLVELGDDRTTAERKSALALAAATGMRQLVLGAPAAMRGEALRRTGFNDFFQAILVGRVRDPEAPPG